jgi:hypothetical protein
MAFILLVFVSTVRTGNRAYENHTISGMTDTATQDRRSAHNVENQGQETTPTVDDRPSRRQYEVAP